MYPRDFYSVPAPTITPQTCFVLMPFAEEFDQTYQAIAEAVTGPEVNFVECKRADEVLGGGHIMADVLAAIGRAEIIIVDVTRRNPNVYYELGIAHTVKPVTAVIIITQSTESVPFDIKQLRCIEYRPDEAGLEGLKHQLTAFVRKAAPLGLRFVLTQGMNDVFPKQKVAGGDRCLYDLSLSLPYVGQGFAKFSLTVNRYTIGSGAEVAATDAHGLGVGESIPVPGLKWRLYLDHVIGDRAYFCLCPPEQG